MRNATIIGLALAGLAWWLGHRAAAALQGSAHSPDGEDASASFRAGIADENSIPDMMPAE